MFCLNNTSSSSAVGIILNSYKSKKYALIFIINKKRVSNSKCTRVPACSLQF